MDSGFCTDCGQRSVWRRPPGDDRERRVCATCGRIHYDNPKIICGCILACGDALLLARRSIEPRRGYWTIPAGFMENGETTAAGAVRECREEVLATPREPVLYGIVSLPRISQVYVLYRGTVAPDGFGAGDESEEVRLFEADALPWHELAFPVVELALRRYLADRARGRFECFEAALRNRPGEPLVEEAVAAAYR